MVVVPSLSNSSSADETIAALDSLLNREASRRAADFEGLRAATSRLDVLSFVADEPVREARGASGAHTPVEGGPTPPPATPTVLLPQRTTHGGDFGPAVRAKLIREALG
jgi:hypothetical protein